MSSSPSPSSSPPPPPPPPKKVRFLVAFDFDHTLIDENTDVAVQELGGSGPLPDSLKAQAKKKVWTDFMQAVFDHHHERKVTEDDYLRRLDAIALTDGMEECVRGIREEGGEEIIISDSNSVFIARILERTGLSGHFRRVFTNPAEFRPDGRLSISYFHQNDDCQLSGRNLCKGRVLEDYLRERSRQGVDFSFVGYAGDGRNDLCPMLRLGEADLAFPKAGDRYSINAALRHAEEEHGRKLRAERCDWKDGRNILEKIREKLAGQRRRQQQQQPQKQQQEKQQHTKKHSSHSHNSQ